MTLLSADLCDPLLELLRKRAPGGAAWVDAVEVGPWFSASQAAAYRRALPGLPFTFHGAGLIARVGILPGALATIKAYINATGSPWISVHMTFWLPGMLYLMKRFRLPMPPPDPRRSEKRLAWQVRRLERALGLPVLLENNDPLPFKGGMLEVQPQYIAQILDETGCDVLLDLGHARIAAQAMGVGIEDYLACFPLERVVQVHASGPRERDGRLFDAHEPLQEEDYRLLGFVLSRCHPRVVTLEYTRERDALCEQLERLRGLFRCMVRGGE